MSINLTNIAPMSEKELRQFVADQPYEEVCEALEEIIGKPLWAIIAKYTVATQKQAILFEMIEETRKNRVGRRRP